MRTLPIMLAAAALAMSLARPARAEATAHEWSPAPVASAHTALQIALVDQWRHARAPHVFERGAAPVDASREARDPALSLGSYVERVWSQVRAYRRPGGAEVLVRTKF